MRQFLLFFISVLFLSSPAFSQASYIKQCGVPEGYDLEIYGDFDMCNFYQRQLDYKAEADKYSRQLKKRRELFVKPRNQVFRQYKADLDLLHYGPDGRMTVTGDAAPKYEDEETE